MDSKYTVFTDSDIYLWTKEHLLSNTFLDQNNNNNNNRFVSLIWEEAKFSRVREQRREETRESHYR